MPQDSLHLNQIDHTLEVLLSTDGHLDNNGVSTQDVLHLLNCLEEVSTRAVHLVHVADTRNVVLVSLTPNSLRLGLNAVSGTVGSYGTVEHAQ